jgi:hypothetical protein
MRLVILISAILFAAPALPTLVVKKGKHFDVVGEDKKVVAYLSAHADEVGEQFVKLFGSFPGKRAAVLLEVEAGEKTWKVNGATWVTTRIIVTDDETVSTFRFQLAKTLIAKHVNGRASAYWKKRHKGFGSYLPDWLDEGIAALHQTEFEKKEDRDLMRQLSGEHSLKEMFAEDHPLGGFTEPAGTVVITVGVYTCTCRSFCEFLHDRYGDEGLRHIVETVLKKKDVKFALPGLAKLRKVPRARGEKRIKKIKDLQAAWAKWLKTK